jgi:hypothetical protein
LKGAQQPLFIFLVKGCIANSKTLQCESIETLALNAWTLNVLRGIHVKILACQARQLLGF